MKLLSFACLFSLLPALVAASSSHYPLQSLSVSITSPTGLAQPQIVPAFNTWNYDNLFYAAEVNYLYDVNVVIDWSAATTALSYLQYKNCGGSISEPDFNSEYPTYCPSVPYAGTSVNIGGYGGFSLSGIAGTNYVELFAQVEVNGVTVPVLYQLMLYNNNPGYDLLVLATEASNSFYTVPYQTQVPAYSLYYITSQNGDSNVNVPFYIGAQLEVESVWVQECIGIGCEDCVFNTGAASGEYDSTDNIYLATVTPVANATYSNNVVGQTTQAPLNFRYIFTGSAGADGTYSENCVRFTSSVAHQAGVGTNFKTVTVGLYIQNCADFLTCETCTQSDYCGWCIRGIAPGTGAVTGQCLYGDELGDQNLDCTPQTYRFALNNWVYSPEAGTCAANIVGDPRINGLQGQDFQVHGTPNEYFNLVTAKDLQINSRFVYLEEAKCDNFTACFSHEGTYIDELGFTDGKNKVQLIASSIDQPIKVIINGAEKTVSEHKHTAGSFTVTFAHPRRVIVRSSHVIMKVSQSDQFFNIESSLVDTNLLDSGSKLTRLSTSYHSVANNYLHGLIGQTWRNVIYAGDRDYEGEVPDYEVQDGLWGSDFHFNLFQN